jgi:hypothetical protein
MLMGAAQVAWGADWRLAIAECWGDEERTDGIMCFLTNGKLRGAKTRKQCVIEAIHAARAANYASAVRWLQACRCGDETSEAADAIGEADRRAVDYAVEAYGAWVE